MAAFIVAPFWALFALALFPADLGCGAGVARRERFVSDFLVDPRILRGLLTGMRLLFLVASLGPG